MPRVVSRGAAKGRFDMKRVRVAVLFGGRSAEHEVSILSARNVFGAIDRSRYDVVAIGISRDGRWRLVSESSDAQATVPASGAEIMLVPGGRGQAAIIGAAAASDIEPIDVLFPVLHGPGGEDGSVQGYAEVADVAYVGCPIFASAAAMDKDMTKRLLAAAGLPVARSRMLHKDDAASFDELTGALGSPLFVKPAGQGSSVGVSRVGGNGQTLATALELAFAHDEKVLVEEFIAGREIECAVLERADGSLFVSEPGEIVTAGHHDFYSYDAKYVDANGAVVKAPADVPRPSAQQAKVMAEQGFRALGCAGMARIDFFLKPDGGLVINEVNTIPGFTNISMYAKAMAASGIAYTDLITALIDHALARHQRGESAFG